MGLTAGAMYSSSYSSSHSFVKGPASGPLAANMNIDTTPVLAATAGVIASLPEEVFAKGGIYGPFELKASSFVHPVMMGTLFLVTLYSGFNGLKWRETRMMGADINALREQEKKLKEEEKRMKEADPEMGPHPEVLRLKEEIKAATAT